MAEKHSKIVSILLYITMGLSGLLAILYYAGAVSENTLIVWAYILVVLTAVMVLAAPILMFIQDPSKIKNALIGVGGLIVVFGISYALASSDTTGAIYEDFEVTAGGSKQIGAIIIGTYILGFGALAVALVSGALNIFKK